MRDSIDAAFAALEARSLRRTKADFSLAAAKASYRRLVAEGHTPEDIDAMCNILLVVIGIIGLLPMRKTI